MKAIRQIRLDRLEQHGLHLTLSGRVRASYMNGMNVSNNLVLGGLDASMPLMAKTLGIAHKEIVWQFGRNVRLNTPVRCAVVGLLVEHSKGNIS